ncbi:AEC family transporter [Thermoproteota archaeon]
MLHSFQVTFGAMLQIFLLSFCGYALAKKKIISVENLRFLSHILMVLFFPCFLFSRLIENFSFAAFPRWWIFPILSFVVTAIGFIIGNLFIEADVRLGKFKREFVSLITFQNSGYLPIVLIALLLPPAKQGRIFAYLFLFLLGFNLMVWSLGVSYLGKGKGRDVELKTIFSPPVIAILVTLVLIAVGANRFIPSFIVRTTRMLGDCVLPLALIVVGGNLAQVNIGIDTKKNQIINVVGAKLFFLPFLCLGLILLFRPPYEIAFLLLLESAVPSATSLSIIMRNYQKEDNIISLGIFWTHVVGLFSIPFFLILFTWVRSFFNL